ncbi:hypothetical protein Ddc_17294 [Ditylenchus destructor]|nr:hypothetical protein Ddc_17294 [Ditylenchus destructor]
MGQASEEPAHTPPPDPTPTPDPAMVAKQKKDMDKFKTYLIPTLIAITSAGCSLDDLCLYFQEDWKKPLNFFAKRFGYDNVVDFLRTLPEDIRISSDLHVTVLPNNDANHVLKMVDKTYVDGKTIEPPKVPRPRVIPASRTRSNMSQNFCVFPRTRPPPLVSGLHTRKKNKWEPPIDSKAQCRLPSRNNIEGDCYYNEPGTSRSIASKYGTKSNFNRNEYAPPGEVEYRRDQYWQRDDYSRVFDEALCQEQEEFYEEDGAMEDDNYSDMSDEFCSAEEFDDDDLLDYDSGAVEQCEKFLEAMQNLKPIPPNLYRMVYLLREAASVQTMEQLKKAYEKRYTTKLDIAELRRVLGAKVAEGAKTSEAAFKLCALPYVFKSAVQPGGTTKVRLILDEDLDDGANSIAAVSF